MTRQRKRLLLGLIAVIVLFTVGRMALRAIQVPSCHDDAVVQGMIDALHDPSLGTLAINNATTVSGWPSVRLRVCTAEIAPVRSGIDAGDMGWIGVTYQVRRAATPSGVAVTAQRGKATVLAPERSEWMQWVASWFD